MWPIRDHVRCLSAGRVAAPGAGHGQLDAVQHVTQVEPGQAGVRIAEDRLDLIGCSCDSAGLVVKDLKGLQQLDGIIAIGTLPKLMLQTLCRQAQDAQGLIDFVGDGRGFQAHLQALVHLVQGLFIPQALLLKHLRDLLLFGGEAKKNEPKPVRRGFASTNYLENLSAGSSSDDVKEEKTQQSTEESKNPYLEEVSELVWLVESVVLCILH